MGLLAGGEPEAFAIHLQDVDMMREAVEERVGEPFRAEDRSPFIEWPRMLRKCHRFNWQSSPEKRRSPQRADDNGEPCATRILDRT